MPKNKTVFFLILMIVVLIFVNIFTLGFLILHRNPNHCTSGDGMGGSPGRYLIEELDFDSSQRELFEELRDDHHQTVEPIMGNIALEKGYFFSELKSEHIDSAKVDSLSKVITNLHQKVDMATFWHFNKIRKICSEKQQIRFEELIKEGLCAPKNKKRGKLGNLLD